MAFSRRRRLRPCARVCCPRPRDAFSHILQRRAACAMRAYAQRRQRHEKESTGAATIELMSAPSSDLRPNVFLSPRLAWMFIKKAAPLRFCASAMLFGTHRRGFFANRKNSLNTIFVASAPPAWYLGAYAQILIILFPLLCLKYRVEVSKLSIPWLYVTSNAAQASRVRVALCFRLAHVDYSPGRLSKRNRLGTMVGFRESNAVQRSAHAVTSLHRGGLMRSWCLQARRRIRQARVGGDVARRLTLPHRGLVNIHSECRNKQRSVYKRR